MNTKIITGLSLIVVLVSGCAATSNPPTSSQEVSTLSNVDRYQAAVNASAWRNGTEVHWVNLPDEGDLAHYTKAESTQDSSSSQQ